ncbi:hypothetical protein C2E25_05665 [Geothermobacter hydrogeniphilus]|uniref:Fibronectin type-III domain-containing protein n=1 Tax=Geothermobacter hydrogeniphilus TaxID=1969733 RepID=A0A2K2HBR2_9BACT|nr:fibronectin type III domain-containing protein [Geothermobacter hydrogeniphilus]PNU20707.1 hypothetical protein C2E25_05665 [Geothermobacter hydrogeniphilus]
MKRRILLLLCLFLGVAGSARAVPEIVSLRVADVTPTSLSLVWMTNVPADPDVEIYADPGMAEPLNEQIRVQPYGAVPGMVAAAAKAKGIFLVRLLGLRPDTSYYLRAVTRESGVTDSVAYSDLLEVRTAATVLPYRRTSDGTLVPTANDLLSFRVYIRPAERTASLSGLGDLLLLENESGHAPIAAFVGEGVTSPEGVVDLNNLYGLDLQSLFFSGGEKVTLRVYRGNTLSVLTHLRRLPVPGGLLQVAAAQRGFNAADLNLDGQVDYQDFVLFKERFDLGANDGAYNPDYDFVVMAAGEISAEDRVDVKDFAWFAGQYGKAE